ncbi:MAG: type II 3-dehydroquinate dehydratase [Aestuariibacter sp.]
MTALLLINGPNLGRLGKRKPEIYGYTTLAQIHEQLSEIARQYNLEIFAFHSNCEGQIIDFIEQHHDDSAGMIINPGALMMAGWSLRDALEDYPSPIVEVHISNLWAREQFRHESVLSQVVDNIISGFGVEGYRLAAIGLGNILTKQSLNFKGDQ